ncbi:sugar ABC transporter permease [Streptomyces sp. NPDC048441]|uniref:sugar ABC transporter permease n=1 Tax=Streptomyces sp. NPDC048441 TaxID=3365552 RepID=UPI00371BB68B
MTRTAPAWAAPAWAAPALIALLDRAALTHAEAGDRFPLFAEPDSGRWTTTRRGSWTGGFWAGLLWLRARHSGEKHDREAARRCTDRLADRVDADTATRGLILWYGTTLADEPGAAELRHRAAVACLDAYDPELGLVPWGSAFGGPRLIARADAVPGLVPLLATVDPSAAESHLRRHLALCAGQMASRFDPATGWIPCEEPPPGWSRGRAWLLLAASDALTQLGADERLDVADHLAGPPEIPLADEDRTEGPLDTSAAAITAVALLKLGRHEPAIALLEQLVHRHLTPTGQLLDGCYDLAANTATRHELIWGDFFLALGLAILTGLVGPHDI